MQRFAELVDEVGTNFGGNSSAIVCRGAANSRYRCKWFSHPADSNSAHIHSTLVYPRMSVVGADLSGAIRTMATLNSYMESVAEARRKMPAKLQRTRALGKSRIRQERPPAPILNTKGVTRCRPPKPTLRRS